MKRYYVIRSNEKFIFDSFERSYISALLGPRRVGKTTLVNYYIEQHAERKWIHLNMDIMSQRNRIAQEELRIMIEQEALQKIGGSQKLWVFIDEAQKSPELFDQIKYIYDIHKGKEHIKFIITASAHLNLHKLTSESLAGRVDLLNLREFNLREMALLQHKDLALPNDNIMNAIFNFKETKAINDIYLSTQPFANILKQSLLDHLVWGGLPETIEEPTEKYRLTYLSNYLQTYLEKDIRALDTIGDLQLYQNLLKMCAEQTGSLRDDQKFIEALHCSRGTLLKYRHYLLATLQYMELFPFIKSTIKRLVKSPKGYITNNGLVSYLTGIHDVQILKTSGIIGHRFETWFLNEIQTYLDTQVEQQSIHFWRTSNGAEVDFVIQIGRHIIPFEVTYSPQTDTKKIHNLKNFLRASPQSNIGVLCYMGPLAYDASERILLLPAWMI